MWISTDLHLPLTPYSPQYTVHTVLREAPAQTTATRHRVMWISTDLHPPLTPPLGHYHEPELVLFDPAEYMWPATVYCTQYCARRQPRPQPPDTESCGYQLTFTPPLPPTRPLS
ncbi:hypothetical protein J6590_060979 [Homalodisca vitripennis]|nr:hypothetical protein J6590_060979 [Homalodisca vitripennis]